MTNTPLHHNPSLHSCVRTLSLSSPHLCTSTGPIIGLASPNASDGATSTLRLSPCCLEREAEWGSGGGRDERVSHLPRVRVCVCACACGGRYQTKLPASCQPDWRGGMEGNRQHRELGVHDPGQTPVHRLAAAFHQRLCTPSRLLRGRLAKQHLCSSQPWLRSDVLAWGVGAARCGRRDHGPPILCLQWAGRSWRRLLSCKQLRAAQ